MKKSAINVNFKEEVDFEAIYLKTEFGNVGLLGKIVDDDGVNLYLEDVRQVILQPMPNGQAGILVLPISPMTIIAKDFVIIKDEIKYYEGADNLYKDIKLQEMGLINAKNDKEAKVVSDKLSKFRGIN